MWVRGPAEMTLVRYGAGTGSPCAAQKAGCTDSASTERSHHDR
jgi:hypothetical protein